MSTSETQDGPGSSESPARPGTDQQRLFRQLYDELRRVASVQLRRERPGHTLRTTALVHEAFLKMEGTAPKTADTAHFIAIAARAMRQVLVDYARRRRADKRGGSWVRTTLGSAEGAIELDLDRIIDLDRALESLDERQRSVVELRFFAGLDEREVASLLGVTERTVRRDWVRARAWLYAELYPETKTEGAVADDVSPTGPGSGDPPTSA